jgi:hypothetical protein
VEKREIGFVALLNYYLSTEYVTTKEIKAKNKKHPVCLNHPKVESSSYARSRESQLRILAEKVYTSADAKRILNSLDEVCLNFMIPSFLLFCFLCCFSSFLILLVGIRPYPVDRLQWFFASESRSISVLGRWSPPKSAQLADVLRPCLHEARA